MAAFVFKHRPQYGAQEFGGFNANYFHGVFLLLIYMQCSPNFVTKKDYRDMKYVKWFTSNNYNLF